ncbi:glycosyltransferase family protein [Glycomyces arizonensis]|uniref:glycosyltransferase family protein n=1 Tax=Glycomyces arizonensis TaxID=256035 RepID=UPI000418BD78|nr:glycosyltransferase [Glycomyces arizonensis]
MSLKQVVKTVVRRRAWLATAVLPLAPILAILVSDGSPAAFLGLLAGSVTLLAALTVFSLRSAVVRTRSLVAAPTRNSAAEHSGAVTAAGPIPERKLRAFSRWEARLNHGWSKTAASVLLQTANTKKEHPEYRVKVLEALNDHYARRRNERRQAETLDLDIVIVSTMNLLGGTTSANEAEILAYRAGGLKVGLVHHPVLDRALDRPIHPRIRALIDDEQIIELHPASTARCDLLIVRFPTAMADIMDDLPKIEAKRTVLLVNQTPYEEYGLAGGYGTPWSVRDVHRNLTEWIGPHTWYAIGPAVRDVLREHHSADLSGVEQAAEFWYETIDIAAWTPETRRIRAEGDPIRIGRHSRDSITKFPNMAKRLRTAYPDAEDIEIHVLGGEKSIRQLLGSIPPKWVSHPFGTMSPVEFLGTIDVYAYFIDENLIEAFGRSPLEAMAAGVPCILPWSFAELFGDGAVYCTPDEVEDHARRLAADADYYAERVEAGLRIVRERFSPEALLRRVGELGVVVDSARLGPAETATAMIMEDAR